MGRGARLQARGRDESRPYDAGYRNQSARFIRAGPNTSLVGPPFRAAVGTQPAMSSRPRPRLSCMQRVELRESKVAKRGEQGGQSASAFGQYRRQGGQDSHPREVVLTKLTVLTLLTVG